MDSKIGFEMNLIVVEAIRGRCASFTVLTATVYMVPSKCVNGTERDPQKYLYYINLRRSRDCLSVRGFVCPVWV